jgi:predicted ATP-grasp superfamily ATP-dependent carboligase
MYLSHDKNQNIKILNSEVTTEEVQKAAKDLKYGQTSGPDGILNEMLKRDILQLGVIAHFFF